MFSVLTVRYPVCPVKKSSFMHVLCVRSFVVDKSIRSIFCNKSKLFLVIFSRNRMTTLSGFVEFFQKGKTFRPKKKFTHGTLRYSLHKQAQASLNSGINLRSVVKLPPGEDLNDWIAVHVVDFFNRINLIYGTISEYCDSASCPAMSGGARFEYLWADGDKYKKPTALPAPQYVTLLMDWIEAQINSETVFPISTDIPFPKTFIPLCRKILTRLFRVFVHVYIHHFDRIVAIGAEAHVNTCYKHFYYFVTEFDLVNPKELEPLEEMTSKVCRDPISLSQDTAPTNSHSR